MLEVNVVEDGKRDSVYAGQIRYNDRMTVLITHSTDGMGYDAIILEEVDGIIRAFDWNSKDACWKTIVDIYPYVAKGKLEIIK
jgi:ribosomal protein L27